MPLWLFWQDPLHHPRINLIFDTWLTLGIILVLFIGFITWVTLIYITQCKILKRVTTMITRDEMEEAFNKFREEIRAEG